MLPLRLALALAVILALHALSPYQGVAGASDDADSTPGPCEDGYTAPTPVAVAVTGVPVVVNSTTNDYFVLYATIPAGPDTTREVPVSVARGEAGTTTLTDRLKPLSADKYRVEKYQVAKPGDLDGDCVDDITELDGLDVYHPLNPGKKIGVGEGSVAVDSEETFKTLAYKGRAPYNFIKFMIFDLDGGNPYVYFVNTNKYLAHDTFADKWHNPRRPGSTIVYGEMEYSPNVVASDGSLGVYHFTLLRGWTYWQAHHVNELLAATMPVLENNLAYRPRIKPLVNSLEAQHSDDRLVILEDEDLHPDVAFVPLNQAEGYGLLRLMEDGDEPRPIDIAIYKSLPNDLPRVAGTITTIPQTPLSHVNLRAIQNSVPNAFIRDVLKDETLKALIGKHVYYAVTGEGYTLREATKKEVDDHHAAARPTETQTPERDLTVTKITALSDVSFDDWDAFGVKAANMAELSKLSLPAGTVPTGFAVPFYFYDEFMKNAGLAEETLFGKKKWPAADKFTLPAGTKLSAVVTQMLAHPRFQADYDVQEEMLDDLRDAIKDADSPDWIIKALEAMHAKYPDGQSLRYRSSTNNEDLPAFNGAGLYDSKTQDSDETTDDGIDKSIKAVWASLWNFRAFLEREYYRVDHTTTAMGVLVHPNYSDELANGVAVSTDPIRFLDGMYYVNTQVGEDLVTNPEPNSLPEELLLDAEGKPIVLSRSSLAKQGKLLMSGAQMLQLRNNLKTIHDRFKTLYNVEDGDDFAVEIEFKITAANKLAIKQARPWVFAPPLTLTPEVAVPSNTPTARSTKEGRTVVTKLAPLVPNAAASWSMSGPDKGAFYIWATPTRRDLYFYPQDYENPEDADGDNVYSIVLTATDPDSGEKTNIDFTMTVVNDPDDDSGDLPVVSIRPLPGIVEGGQARFVVSADPAPAETIAVNVNIGQDGRFIWSSGMMTAWVSTSGRATIGSGTRDDDTDEPDGSVSATLRPGVGYTVSADEGTASVGVADNDGPPDPEVSVTAGSDVTEGGDAQFTVTATPSPTAPLSVSLTVGQEGAFGAITGTQTVTIPTEGSATVAVGTADDDSDEPDGSVSVTVDAGDGYTASATQGTASVGVADNDDPPPAPEVNITASRGGSEGENVTFTLTAAPAPTSDLAVLVTVAASGDFGVSTGSQTVTIPAAGSATLTIATTDDDADEPDGSVTLSLNDGDGYTVGSLSTETVSVLDNDDAPLATSEVSVTSGGDVTEGADAQFTVTADPAPSAPLTVNLTVGQKGDYGAATGTQTVTIPTAGSATVAVATADDDSDEPDGSVSVTVDAADGYSVSATQGTASVGVADNDDAPKTTDEEESNSTADVDLGQVEVGKRISYVAPSLKPAGAEDCSIGAGILWKRVGGGKEVTTRSDNGFSLDYSGGLPRLSGRAKLRAAPALYRIEYVCGHPQSWSGSYTIAVEVIGAGMGFDADSLGRRTLYKDQQRTIKPPQLFYAEGAVTYAVSPALPAGLSLDTATGVISGAPTTLQGQITYTVTATDSKTGGAQTATFDVRLSVVSGMHWSASSMPDMVFEAGERIEIVPPAVVNPTTHLRYTYSATHNGVLTMHPYSGRLLASSARPMVKNTYTITAYEDRAYDDRTPQRISITVNVEVQDVHLLGAGQTVSIPAMALPGLSGKITYALAGQPALPSGLSFDSDSGVLSGTLDADATQAKQTYTVTGTDANGNTADYRFKIEVRKLVLSGTQSSYSVGAGDPLSISLAHSGGIGAVSYSISPASSELPGGVSFNTKTGAISGTPSREFAEKAFTVTATDSANPPQTASYSVSIRVNPSAKVPRVSIAAGSAITEGGSAVFTVTAGPAPSSPLLVDVTVSQDGDFGASTGLRTVTVPTSGSVTVNVGTTDDSADEADGSVSVAVDTGNGYTVSSTQGSASVDVSDNDDPPSATPEISVTAGSAITEGGSAVFTVTAGPAPSSPLLVDVSVSQDGDFGASTGARTVTVPTSGSVTVNVGTTDDSADETDGSVSVSVDAGDGYTVSSTQGSASVDVSDNDDPPPAAPEISVTAGSAITEGGSAVFTVAAGPAPSSPLLVDVTVSQDGDFGASAGSRTVTIPTSGSVTVTVGTSDDGADETDGSVSVSVDAGDGYTVSSTQGSASVAVSDNDDPPPATPEVSLTAGGGVTEGQGAVFTVSASPAPSSPLLVDVTVSQDGDFGASTGARTVTVPTSGSVTVTVGTSDDGADETDGSVSVSVDAGDGYTVSSTQGSASVAVSDNDDPPPADTATVSVADASVVEGATGYLTLLVFEVVLSEASDHDVTVHYEIRGVTAIGGSDYWGGIGRTTIWAGRTRGTIGVNVVDDYRSEGAETLFLELTDADGAVIANDAGEANGTIYDND